MSPFPGLVNFFPAVAYHFCLNLPAAFSQHGNGLILRPCIVNSPKKIYKVYVFKIGILPFPLILAGKWNMGDMKVETL